MSSVRRVMAGQRGPGVALGRAGEIILVGVLTFVCSLPLLTMAAAQAAAIQALNPLYAGAPGTTGVYLRALKASLGRGILVQVIWLAVGIVGGLDLWFGLSCPPETLLALVFSAFGGLVLVFAMMVRPFLAATLSDRTGRRPVSVRTQVRAALAMAGVSPWRTLLMALLDLVTVLSALVSLVLAPLVGGFVLAVQARLLGGAQERLQLSTRRRRFEHLTSQPSSTGQAGPWA